MTDAFASGGGQSIDPTVRLQQLEAELPRTRQLAIDNLQIAGPEYGQLLFQIAGLYIQTGNIDKARPVMSEFVALTGRLAEVNPEVGRPMHALALFSFARISDDLSLALDHALRASALYEDLVRAEPRYIGDAYWALLVAAQIERERSNYQESIALHKRAVGVVRAVNAVHPNECTAEYLATVLVGFAAQFPDLLDEVQQALAEVAQLLQEIRLVNEVIPQIQQLAGTLYTLMAVLTEREQHHLAMQAFNLCTEIYKVISVPDVPAPDLLPKPIADPNDHFTSKYDEAIAALDMVNQLRVKVKQDPSFTPLLQQWLQRAIAAMNNLYFRKERKALEAELAALGS